MGRYGEIWGEIGRYLARTCEIVRDKGEIWGDLGRFGEKSGDIGRDCARFHEIRVR